MRYKNLDKACFTEKPGLRLGALSKYWYGILHYVLVLSNFQKISLKKSIL